MKIAADQLKELSKKLRGLGGELFNFNGTQAYTSVPNLDLVVDFKTDAGFAVSGEKFSQIVARLNGEVRRVLELPEVRARLALDAFEPVGSTPEYLAGYIKSELAKWVKVVKQSGAKID